LPEGSVAPGLNVDAEASGLGVERGGRMTAQQEKSSSALARPTAYSWPRDMADFMSSFWSDLDWPRRMLGSTEGGSLRIEETVDDDTMIVRAEIPGVDPDKDVEISVDDGFLTISAKRESKIKETKDGTVHSEFRYGSFMRQLRMPKNADLNSLAASYTDGVIEITVPLKAEEAPTAHKVEIKRS
jgi:HSP20 family protein